VSKTALVTGITGQDGTYLAEYLLERGYRVVGVIRGQNNPKRTEVAALIPKLEFVEGDLTDLASLIAACEEVRPDEIYNLGAISFVALSWKQPELTGDVTGLGVTRMLEAMRRVVPEARFYQASSSEMFGKVREVPQHELTPFHPRSPYGVAKTYGHYITVNYRESYRLFACGGICFNHESPRRGTEFSTRKITHAVARIKHGLQNEVELGNLDSRRDWGYAPDFVRAMHQMLQQPEADDFVIATGETHSVREFAELAFAAADMPIRWEIEKRAGPSDARVDAMREVGVNDDRGVVVRVSEKFFRPAEVDLLVGDSSKARRKLGWAPTITLGELARLMVESDLREVRGQIRD
jgi:GDPmannose 4,6-dehydratase